MSVKLQPTFGYVGEVDSSVIRRESYYQIGDYIGMSGIEKFYEKELREKKGVTKYLVDVHNKVKGSFQSGMLMIPLRLSKIISTY